jgi:hypothetical protein
LKKKSKPRLYAHFLINSLRPVDSENYTDVIQYLTIMNSVGIFSKTFSELRSNPLAAQERKERRIKPHFF